MDLSQLEAKVRRLTSEDADFRQRIPGVVLTSQTKDSAAPYVLSAGKQSLKTESAMDENTVFWIASVTKLMTTIAAMQCVERGQIDLESDVTTILPELGQLQLLEGFEGDSIKTRDVRGTITLRRLLTHSSGIGYDILNPNLLRCQEGKPKAFCGELDRAFFHLPLVYEPGEGWQYGAGIDWAGVLIERLNGGIKLGEFLQENVCTPLGMQSTTFHLEDRPDLASRLATVWNRTADGLVPVDWPPIYASPARDDSGGAGAYSSPADVMKLLHAILCADRRILKPETIDEMFRPQLQTAECLESTLRDPAYKMGMTSSLPDEASLNFGLGGLLCLSDLDTGRRGGSMQWGGYPNLAWWIDRVGGRCGLYASQLLPSRDQVSIDLKWDFERAVYASSDKE